MRIIGHICKPLNKINIRQSSIITKTIACKQVVIQIKFSEILGPIQIRALMETLTDTKFIKVKHIEIWKAKIEDEGIRNICKYLELREGNQVDVLDVLDN